MLVLSCYSFIAIPRENLQLVTSNYSNVLTCNPNSSNLMAVYQQVRGQIFLTRH